MNDQGPISDSQAKSRRFVRLFKPRFASLVRAGTKTQTVRPVPQRMPRAGDILDARQWSGLPYRSKQVKIGEYVISQVKICCIQTNGIFQQPPDGCLLAVVGARIICHPPGEPADRFARADGFTDWPEMLDWFRNEHGLKVGGHFDGIIIYWT